MRRNPPCYCLDASPLRVKMLPGKQREGRPRASERDEEEGYRSYTVVVCGKSVHIIRRNRKEEISVGIRDGGESEYETAG